MRHTTIEAELEIHAFVRDAAEAFAKDIRLSSWRRKDFIEDDCYMALRWGIGEDCIVVIKVDSTFSPVLYAQVIEKKEPSI